MEHAKRVAVVGGGASGLAAAIAAAQEARRRGDAADVVLYEADERVGRSVLATGNGRCNFSNARPDALMYRNAPFVAAAFRELALARPFPNGADALDPVHAFFADLGLVWREEGEGRLYPLANKATVVLDVLRARAAALGVCEETGRAVEAVEEPSGARRRWGLRFADRSVEHADAVVLAVGGRGVQRVCLPEPLRATPGRAVLGPLRTRDERMAKGLDNIRVRCAVWLEAGDGRAACSDGANDASEANDAVPSSVLVSADASDGASAGPSSVSALSDGAAAAAAARERWAFECGQDPARDLASAANRPEPRRLLAREEGELLFRSYGVSGIAVFNLSRFARPGDRLLVDFLPQVRACDAEAFLMTRRKRLVGRVSDLTVDDFLRGLLLGQVARAVLAQAGVRSREACGKAQVRALAKALKGFSLEVAGGGDARQCQVTRGGLDVSAFDARTMEALDLPGLFATGEAFDVDAPCGGYNLHWAWASGLLAGCGAVARAMEGGRHA